MDKVRKCSGHKFTYSFFSEPLSPSLDRVFPFNMKQNSDDYKYKNSKKPIINAYEFTPRGSTFLKT
jgi:hypothetical protein